MIDFIENKPINWEIVQDLLKESHKKNHWTNFGPLSLLLEEEITKQINLSGDLAVVVCSSGSMALHCLVNLHVYLQKKALKWVVCSFGFPCLIQGPLKNSIIIDCDEKGMLDLNLLKNIDYDGIIVTNLFGLHNLDCYRQFCLDENKILICDSATAYDTIIHGSNEIISFHQTKPWGMGEGGCIIIKKEYVQTLKSIVNLGLVTNEPVGELAFNAKISDFSCAFIIQRLRQMKDFTSKYREQYSRIISLSKFTPIGLLNKGTPSNVPLLVNRKILNLTNKYVILKKYYKPLDNSIVANNLYDRIVNFPCHPGISELSDDEIIEVLNYK